MQQTAAGKITAKTDSTGKERLLRVGGTVHTPCMRKLRPSLLPRVVGVEVFEASSPVRSGQFEQRRGG